MAINTQNFLDLSGLTRYDGKIKNWSNSIAQAGIKTVLKTADGNSLKFYKKPSATLSDTADFTIDLGSEDAAAKLAALATVLGATWDSENKVYTISLDSSLEATTVVGAINEVISDFNNFIGAIPSGASATTVVGYAKEVATAAENAAKTYADGLVEALDADVDATGTAQHAGTFVVSGITEVNGVITAVDSVEVEAAGAAAALDATLAAIAKSGDAADAAYDNTTSGLTATNAQTAIDEVVGGLGTAAAADVATQPIAEQSTDAGLVSAAQVATFVASEIAGLEGAMHFIGVITRQTGETDAEAIARVVTNPEAGDTVVMSDNGKEYIYDGTTWREIGDETEFVKKTTTIAGVDLQDSITKAELLTALNIEDGANVNVIESVQVNGSALTPDANKAVNVTVAEGATNGTIAVNGADVAVHGLGSAAYAATTDFDAAGTAAAAIAELDGTATVATATMKTVEGSQVVDYITIKGSVKETDGIIGNDATVDDVQIGSISTASIDALFA